MRSSTGTAIRVTVAYSPAAGRVEQVSLALPAGSTLADALAASGLPQRFPEIAALPVGIWGRKEEPGAELREADRIEVYRPLLCDPKEARRLRYRQKAQRDAERLAAKAARGSAAKAPG